MGVLDVQHRGRGLRTIKWDPSVGRSMFRRVVRWFRDGGGGGGGGLPHPRPCCGACVVLCPPRSRRYACVPLPPGLVPKSVVTGHCERVLHGPHNGRSHAPALLLFWGRGMCVAYPPPPWGGSSVQCRVPMDVHAPPPPPHTHTCCLCSWSHGVVGPRGSAPHPPNRRE